MVRTPREMPEMLIAAVKLMMIFAIPPIGIPMGVVIGSGLAAQGVKGQDKAHHQDNVNHLFRFIRLPSEKNLHPGFAN